MPTPCKEQLLAAVATALGGITGVSGFTAASVERDREIGKPIIETEFPRLVIYEGAELPADAFTGEDGFQQTIEIHGAALGATLAEARATGAVLRAKIRDALWAAFPFDNKARDLQPAEEPPPVRLALECLDRAYGFELSVTIEYATKEGDSFTFA